MAAIIKIYFDFLLLNWKDNWLETPLEVFRWLVDQKQQLQTFWLEMYEGESIKKQPNLFLGAVDLFFFFLFFFFFDVIAL